MKKSLAILVLLLWMQPHFAVATHTTYDVFVPQKDSCGDWTQVKKEDDKNTERSWIRYAQYKLWLMGFITGYGYGGDDMAETNGNAMLVWMNNYCQENPLDTILVGAKKLVYELKQRHEQE